MSDRDESRGRDQEAVARLLELAGPPAPPAPVPDAARRRLRAHGRRVWQESLHRQEPAPAATVSVWRRPAARTLLAAAVLLAAVGLALFLLRPGQTPQVATLAAAFPAGAGGYQPEQTFAAGAVVTTGPAQRLALRLADGTSVRLDEGSRLELTAPDRLALRDGALYVDSQGRGPGLTVATPFGEVRDVGTQFTVRLLPAALRVQVREGEVLLRHEPPGEASAQHRATAGTVLEAGPGGVQSSSVAPDDPSWHWATATAPPFDLEGRTLAEVLRWVSRETGWTLRWASPALERHAGEIVVHGQLGGVRPDEAPDLVVPGAGLRHRVVDGTLWIEP